MREFFTTSRRKRFEAIQRCLVPRSRGFDDARRRVSAELINGVLAYKSGLIRCKIALFLLLIDLCALVTGGRCFASLNEERQNQVMCRLFDSPVALLRKGFWGINTLAKMGVYGQECLYEELGYKLRPTP